MRPLAPLLALAAAALAATALPAAAAAKPHVAATFATAKGVSPGGAHHGMIAGPDGDLWMTTSTAPPKRPVLLRVTPKGKMSSIKVPVPTGMDFTGLGVGPDHRVWFSGTASGGTHRGYSGHVAGRSVQMKEAADSASWDSLAVVGSTAYVVDGFNDVRSSTDGLTFTGTGGLTNAGAWSIAANAGQLVFAGDDAAGTFAPGAAQATLFTSPDPAVPFASRALTVAGGQTWILLQPANAPSTHVAVVGAGGTATLHAVPSGGQDIVTGPDGAPWILTQDSVVRLGPSGAVTAKVKLPSGQRGIELSGGPGAVWVGTLTTAGAGHVVRVATH